MLKPKQIQKGDVVLAYTLKPPIEKIKNWGFGSCIVKETSSSGVFKFSTLDGESMLNWIRKYRIKKYELSLTGDMLARMHATRTRKEAIALWKEEAQVEEKECIWKIKPQREMVVAILVPYLFDIWPFDILCT